METANLLFRIWIMQSIIGGALCAPILFFGRKRAGFAFWQLLALIVPFLVWLILMFSPLAAGRKSLANLGEPVYISFAMAVLALVRVAIGRKVSERVCAVS